ncbi:MAG: AmmeMemoRadiSam system protein A [Bdellovibrionaceae bacterium]|nr:AmmeMemoRadiSam system protein A [Pseudobdellovibrionaceae bacterium]
MNELNREQQQILLKVAKDAIAHRFDSKISPHTHDIKYDQELHQQGACFVTLKYKNQLRGCIGSLEAHRPLIEDVVGNAISAAFFDPRFPALTEDEWPEVQLSISVLSPREPIQVQSEQELLQNLRPGVDGLFICADWRKATFLPSVWEELPEPQAFLQALKRKAGFALEEWPSNIEVERYTSQNF